MFKMIPEEDTEVDVLVDEEGNVYEIVEEFTLVDQDGNEYEVEI